MPISKNIIKEHVLKALAYIDEKGVDNFKKPLGYELIYEGKRYPPKEVLRLANIECTGTNVDLLDFNGGKPTNNPLIKLGFTIVLKGTNVSIGMDYSNKKKQSGENRQETNYNIQISDEKEIAIDVLKSKERSREIKNSRFPLEVPAIRLLPMSENDPEFTEKSIEEVQEWFINKLPFRPYNFKKGMNTANGTLVLFQFKGCIIASAILEEKIFYKEATNDGYRGAYKFLSSSISIFTPIKSEEIKRIWKQFKSFNQSTQELDHKKHVFLYELLSSKQIISLADADKDEESFQEEIEKTKINNPIISDDKPKERMSIHLFNSETIKWQRNQLTSKRAIILAGYRCEYDNSHLFFKSFVTGENYVEAHHLIPMEFQEQFEKSLDVEGNIISLCPLCHKKVHHAIFEEKEAILKQLYNERKSRIKKCGIDITEEALLTYYK